MIDFEELADAPAREVTDEELRGCSAIAERIRTKTREITASEKNTDRLKGDLSTLVERTLPDAMKAVGLKEFKLSDGSSVTVAEEYYANIPSADSEEEGLRMRREAAFAWLRANNSGDLIKNEVKAAFGRGDDELAAEFARVASELNVPLKQSETVHRQTLKAWVRERIESGKEIPLETFGVCIKNVATIKGPKTK